VSWIARKGFSYRIAAGGGAIELTYRDDALCRNAPKDVKDWFGQKQRAETFLGTLLSITYERTPDSVYRDRARLEAPLNSKDSRGILIRFRD
jgi:hypothetical protein